MQQQFEQFYLEYSQYKECVGSQGWNMSKSVWGDFIAKNGCLSVPRELRLMRKELGLSNDEYIMLLDYLDSFESAASNIDQHLAALNGVSERAVQRRFGVLEKKGFLRRDLHLVEGRIKGFTYNPEPLMKKLESLDSSYVLDVDPKDANRACESREPYESRAQEQEKIKEKKWKDEFCSTRWYNDVFSEMYEEAAGQPVLTGGREYKSAETYFNRLRQLNPEFSAEDIFRRATEGARYILDSQLEGGVFGWLHKPPDICMLANQAQAVDYQLRYIERLYREEEEFNNVESTGSKVEILFTKKCKEKENASEQIEKMYRELREIEHGDVQRDIQESNGSRLPEDKS